MFKQLAVLAASVLTSVAAIAATGWDLATDYRENSNPNGVWTYGQLTGADAANFSALAWNAPTSSYGVNAVGQTFVYQRTAPGFDYGIESGKVSLESDYGNAAVRWTAPTAGDYSITIAVGGSLASGTGGSGNAFAQYAGVRVNGVGVPQDSFASNVKLWSFTLALAADATVDAFVLNPGFSGSGNTQTEFAVSAVPEPSGLLLSLVAAGMIGAGARQRSVARSATR